MMLLKKAAPVRLDCWLLRARPNKNPVFLELSSREAGTSSAVSTLENTHLASTECIVNNLSQHRRKVLVTDHSQLS